MAVLFEIENVFKITNRGYYVFARQLAAGQNFVVTDKSFLGGVELGKYLDMPRALDYKGEQRNDLFAFQIKNDQDNSKLKPKEVVELIPGDTLHYLNPWHADDTDLTVQLYKEINKKHILYGKTVKTIARRKDNDDVLFEVENSEFMYAIVHLTWAQKTLDDPKYPRTETYNEWQDVYENRIAKDHEGWEDE